MNSNFSRLPVRQEEKHQLKKLLARPIPSVDDPAAKINVQLLQFVLVSDTMVYITQFAGRILRAIFEICGPSQLELPWIRARRSRRAFGDASSSVQGCPGQNHSEDGKQFPWERYYDLPPPEIGELLGIPNNAGRLGWITSPCYSCKRKKVHGGAETFIIMAEDVDREAVLFRDTFKFFVNVTTKTNKYGVTLTVHKFGPVPPNYFISIVSDRWLHAETRLPISFQHLILPGEFPPPTPFPDLQGYGTASGCLYKTVSANG
ncbi:hypothetical protein F5887DRAFT_1087438 [Amanita rubescens]|nr:hypothetical protein F5887DRAFT_1087438 [Amanita rubescens]